MVILVLVLSFFFSTNLFPRYRVRYFHHDTDPGTVESTYYKFRIGLFRLIEYTDPVNQQFVKGTSNVIKVWNLLHNAARRTDTLLWSKLVSTDISSNGTAAWDLSTSLVFSDGTRLTMTGAFAASQMRDNLHHRMLNPNAVKFSIDITNIQWTVNNSRLAIVAAIDAVSMKRTRVNTTATPVDPNDGGESEIDVGDNSEGRLTWTQNIVASWATQNTTSNYPVIASDLLQNDVTWTENGTVLSGDDSDAFGDETRQIIIYSIISPNTPGMQPSSIMWDPAQQVDDATLDTVTSGSSNINPFNEITYFTILTTVLAFAILQ